MILYEQRKKEEFLPSYKNVFHKIKFNVHILINFLKCLWICSGKVCFAEEHFISTHNGKILKLEKSSTFPPLEFINDMFLITKYANNMKRQHSWNSLKFLSNANLMKFPCGNFLWVNLIAWKFLFGKVNANQDILGIHFVLTSSFFCYLKEYLSGMYFKFFD